MIYEIKRYIIEEGVLQHVKDNMGKYAAAGLGLAAAGSGEFGSDIQNATHSVGDAVGNVGSHAVKSGQSMTDYYNPGHAETITADAREATQAAQAQTAATEAKTAATEATKYDANGNMKPVTGPVVNPKPGQDIQYDAQGNELVDHGSNGMKAAGIAGGVAGTAAVLGGGALLASKLMAGRKRKKVFGPNPA